MSYLTVSVLLGARARQEQCEYLQKHIQYSCFLLDWRRAIQGAAEERYAPTLFQTRVRISAYQAHFNVHGTHTYDDCRIVDVCSGLMHSLGLHT